MEVFAKYSWPGNVRELQNFIERTVILSPGTALRPPLEQLKEACAPSPSPKLSTLEEAEREHVPAGGSRLQLGYWRAEGRGGAARDEAHDLAASDSEAENSLSSGVRAREKLYLNSGIKRFLGGGIRRRGFRL